MYTSTYGYIYIYMHMSISVCMYVCMYVKCIQYTGHASYMCVYTKCGGLAHLPASLAASPSGPQDVEREREEGRQPPL